MNCIYRIRNLINGKTYIGRHKYKKLDDTYFGSGILIKQAIKKYGKENFTKEILEANIDTVELANDFEQMYILFERAKGKAEYNLTDGGDGCKGYKYSEETKRKISETKKGKKNPMYGGNFSEDHKNNLSKNSARYWAGKHLSEKTKRKISETKKGVQAWNKGKELSKSQKERILKLSIIYKEYKLKGGLLKWNEFQKFYKDGVISNGS